jgi:phospholipase C
VIAWGEMSRGVNRRDALKVFGALAGAATVGPKLSGCGDGAEPGRISTIVVVMMENRSYDHYLGSRSMLDGKPGDGLLATMSNPDMAGVSRPVYHESVDCVADPPHGWTASRNQWNHGANDGFYKDYQRVEGASIPPHVLGYFTAADLPVLHGLADAYTTCDRWFSSVLGPTWPNRLYLCGAQSGGTMSNALIDNQKYTFPTIFDRLEQAGIDWVYYFSDAPFVLQTLARVSEDRGKLIDRFFVDAAAGKLPPVVFVDPAFLKNDDHPPHHPLLGQQFLGAVHAALAASPQWNELLLVITYDEHGGFFDHVPPPKAPDERAAQGFDQLGFRVPAIIAGPYARRGHVSSVVREHTSITRHIGRMFDLEPLTVRDAAAMDLSEALDTDRLARNDPAPPASLPAVEVDESMIERACFLSSKPIEIVQALDAGTLSRALDGRAAWRDQAHLFGEVLDRAGAGRVRRGR